LIGHEVLSAQQVVQYFGEGYTYPVKALTADEVQRYRASLTITETELAHEERPLLMTNLHLSFRWAYELAHHPRVVGAVRDLIGPNIVIYSTLVFAKSGGDSKFVSWHQDGRFLVRNSEPVQALTAWIALTPSTAENGCLLLVPGSHRGGRLPHVNTYAPGNMLLRGETIEGSFEGVAVTLNPGEMSLHHVDTVHGSKPNRSAEPRTGFTVRYLHPAAAPNDDRTMVIPVGERPGAGPPLCSTGKTADEVAAHLRWVRRSRAAVAAKEG
jgi:ectoine hydroxylase-related dioxygenase (phytanoyl-CoA dioxygenase family)